MYLYDMVRKFILRNISDIALSLVLAWHFYTSQNHSNFNPEL